MADAIHLDDTDRRLLDLLQTEFPLAARPFAALAERLGLDETDTLRRVRRLKAKGLIRQISAIFDSRRLGYRSTLAAFRVANDSLDDVAATVSRHPGVSHNYARDHAFNLWFTLTVPPETDVADEVARLAREPGVERYLLLPAERTFKIGVNFRMSDAAPADDRSDNQPDHSHGQPPFLSTFDRTVIRELQADLPLVPTPFAPMASRLVLAEEELLAKARAFRRTGVMRRFGAVLRHRRAGYRANGMGCWVVPPERCAAVGQRMAQFAEVSHCYQRPAHPPDWPYRLFTMIHGHGKDEVEATARRIAQATGVNDYTLLYSTKEYKKERVRYFVDE